MYEASIIMIIQRFVTSVLDSRSDFDEQMPNGGS
jgi:hypothetical protein